MPPKRPTPIVQIIDDDDVFRESLRAALESLEYQVFEFDDAQQFLDRGELELPSCTIVDLCLPVMSGLTLCRKLNEIESCTRVVVVTGFGDIGVAVEAMKLGVVDFLEKPASISSLHESVDSALRKSRALFEETRNSQTLTERLDLLTPREHEVFEAVLRGMGTKRIAKLLGISTKTVDVHRSSISKKLDVDSPMQLAKYVAVRRDLMSAV